MSTVMITLLNTLTINLLALIKNGFSFLQISDDSDKKAPDVKPGLFEVMKSVLSAMIGVQSDENRERDFNKGSAKDYVLVGIIFIIIFIVTLMMVVSSVVDNS